MPNSSQNEVEDIFSPISAAEAVYDSVEGSTEESVESVVIPGQRRRRILIVATVVLALLLLSGGGAAIWLWWQHRPEPVEPVNTITNASEVVNVADVSVNANTTPTNTNATSFVDVDHDGLSDEEELVENTNPKKKDTDEDGLSDREEVRVYDTDPRNPDTDSDGYSDGDEVTHFYHPNHPDPKKRLFDLPQ